MRPCGCENFVPGEPFTKGRDCYLCWLYHRHPGYKALWDDDRRSPPAVAGVAISQEEQEERLLAQRLATWAKAMATEMSWRTAGGKPPTDEERAARRAKCDDCNDRDTAKDLCKICGCYLEPGLLPPRPLGKLDCATQRCPRGLWTFAGGYSPAKSGGCGGGS